MPKSKVEQARELLASGGVAKEETTTQSSGVKRFPIFTQNEQPQKTKVQIAQEMLNNGMTPDQIRQNTEGGRVIPKQDGFFKTVAKEIVTPVARLGANFALAGRTAQGLVNPQAMQEAERIKTNGINLPLVGQVKPVGVAGAGNGLGGFARDVADAVGVGTEIASTVIPSGKAPSIFGKFMTGKIATGIGTGATVGGVGGGLFGLGRGVQEESQRADGGFSLGNIVTDTAVDAAAGLVGGGVLGGVGGVFGKVTAARRFARDPKPELQSELRSFIEGKRSLVNATERMKRDRNTDVVDIISDPTVFEGVKPVDGSLNVDAAIATLRSTTDDLMDANRSMLPRINEYTTPVKREDLRAAAYAKLRGTKNQIANDKKKIDAELNAYDEYMSLLEVDELRASSRESAKIKADDKNIFDAIMEASRDTVFEKSEQVANRISTDESAKVFGSLRTMIKDNLNAIEFLDKTLRGQKVPGGRLGAMFAQGVGAIIGSNGGPLTALIGAKAGDAIARIAMNNRLGGSIRMGLIRKLNDDPAVLKAAQELIKQIDSYNPLSVPALPAPAIRLPAKQTVSSVSVIPAEKGIPGRDIKTGKFFKTYLSGQKNGESLPKNQPSKTVSNFLPTQSNKITKIPAKVNSTNDSSKLIPTTKAPPASKVNTTQNLINEAKKYKSKKDVPAPLAGTSGGFEGQSAPKKYKTTVNLQDKNDLEYLERIFSRDTIEDIKAGKTTNWRGESYEDLAQVNFVSEKPLTVAQKLEGKISDVKLKSNTFYHGTSAENAQGIMTSGFKVGSSLPKDTFRGGGYGKMQNSISLAETPKEASIFSQLTRDGEIVEVKLKDNAKVVSIKGVEDAIDLEDYISYLKKEKVDAVYIGGGEKELVVINTKAVIPTKSQLTDIWKKANKAAPEQSLIAEAKKYKSAEEFVKAQGTPVYHGTKSNIDIKNITAQPESRGQYLGNGIYFTKFKEGADLYGGKTINAIVNEKDFLNISNLKGVDRTNKIGSFGTYKQYLKNSNLEDTEINFKKWQKNQQEVADKILDMGYKGVTDGQQHVIFDKSALKTKSQLTDIWNKAHGK